MTTAIQQYEGGAFLTQWRDPEEVLAEATKAAVALKRVVSMKTSPVKFNGEQYLEREDWGTVAKFYGCYAKPMSTEYVEFGPVRGFKATAVVIDRDGIEVGRAESMCLNDEDNWGDVPFYEWVDELDANGKKIWDAGKSRYKAKKVKAGSKPKPLFQLMSMAQTRAEAKALKGVFSWVVVLAGYKPTPAEEMTQDTIREQEPQREPIQQPQSTKQTQQATQAAGTNENAATQPQEEMIEGVIEQAKPGNNASLWLSLKTGKIVWVHSEKVVREMAPGYAIKCMALLTRGASTDFYQLGRVLELKPLEDEPPTGELAADAQEVAKEMFPPAQGNAAVQTLVDNGSVTTASNLTVPKTIGVKRAQRIYALSTTHKADNYGFDEAAIKKVLAALPRPLEHLRDLETGMYEEFESMATGKTDWREFVEDDPDGAADGID